MMGYKKYKFHFYKTETGSIAKSSEFQYWQKYIDGLPRNNEYYVTISKVFKKRTLKQNNYWYGGIIERLAREWGWTPEEMKYRIKFHFATNYYDEFPFLLEKKDGAPDRLTSSADWSTAQMASLVEKILQWALTEYGIKLMTPNEYKNMIAA